jgi:hypothetical protein
MVAMRNDQIRIGYGPTRYKGPKGLKRELDNLPEVTQNVSDNFNELVTVSTYDPLSREGTGTSFDGEFINYTNTSTSSLSPDDVIIVTLIDDEYYAIGISERAGYITPVELPAAAALSASFPIVTNPDLTFDISAMNTNINTLVTGYSLCHDMAGGYGIGTDSIIGRLSLSTINAFTRSSSVNSSLFSAVGSYNDMYLQQGNGTIMEAGTTGTYSYRRPADTSYTTFTATNGNDYNAFDQLTENMWTWSWTNAGVGPSNFWRMSDTDSSPVDKGNLGMPNSTLTKYRVLIAGHGYLAAFFIDTATPGVSNMYMKPANDDTNFTLVATYNNTAFDAADDTSTWLSGTDLPRYRDMRITPNGDVTYIYKSTLTTTWHIKLLQKNTSVVYDYDTNIPSTYTALTFTRDALQGHMHTSSGLVILQGIADDVTLGAATPGFYPATAAYNYISSTYIYYDPDLPDNLSAVGDIKTDIPIEIDPGVIRFMYYSNTDQNGAIPAQDRVYELTGV